MIKQHAYLEQRLRFRFFFFSQKRGHENCLGLNIGGVKSRGRTPNAEVREGSRRVEVTHARPPLLHPLLLVSRLLLRHISLPSLSFSSLLSSSPSSHTATATPACRASPYILFYNTRCTSPYPWTVSQGLPALPQYHLSHPLDKTTIFSPNLHSKRTDLYSDINSYIHLTTVELGAKERESTLTTTNTT